MLGDCRPAAAREPEIPRRDDGWSMAAWLLRGPKSRVSGVGASLLDRARSKSMSTLSLLGRARPESPARLLTEIPVVEARDSAKRTLSRRSLTTDCVEFRRTRTWSCSPDAMACQTIPSSPFISGLWRRPVTTMESPARNEGRFVETGPSCIERVHKPIDRHSFGLGLVPVKDGDRLCHHLHVYFFVFAHQQLERHQGST